MKVLELFEAAAKHPILDELKGKKMDWLEMTKFLDSHTEVFEKKGATWHVKKDAGVNLGPIMTALKKAAKDSADPFILLGKSILVDWADKWPIEATVMLDQRVLDKSGSVDEFKKQQQEDFAWAMKNAKGTAGGKGWYVGHNNTSYPVYGRFDEGPQKGDLFRVEGGIRTPRKKGDKIKVLITSTTYGRVKLA